jgi:hypothetical protein
LLGAYLSTEFTSSKGEAGGLRMATEELLKTKFNKHPEYSINGNTSLDDEFISLIICKPELNGLINTEINKCMDPFSIYIEIILKLAILESADIKTLLTDYINSQCWNSLDSDKQLEFIENSLSIQEDNYRVEIDASRTYEKQAKLNNFAASKAKKVDVPFDMVADRILQDFHIFTMQDNKEIYIYSDGVYKSEGSDAILDNRGRVVYNEIYTEYWTQRNPMHELTHIPHATTRYVAEVIAHIRAFTYTTRESIEKDQSKYINLKNKLLNLETLEFESHNPEIRSISQIPVDHNEKVECPRINRFLVEQKTDC